MMNDVPAMIQNYKVNTHKAREGKQKGGVRGWEQAGEGRTERERMTKYYMCRVEERIK